MRPDRTVGLGFTMALLSAATFGTSGSFARSLINAGWSPPAAVAGRVGIAALALAVPAALAARGRWSAVRRSARGITLFGLLAIGAAQVGFFNAVRYLPVGVALLVEYLGIILVVAWMWAVHGQRPQRLTIAGGLVAIVGLVFVLNLTGKVPLHPIGVLWGLVAAVGLAAYFVMSARVDAELPSVTMASAGMAVGAVALAALGAVGVLPMHATFGAVAFAGHRTSWLVPLLGLALVAAVVPYVTGIAANRILGARLASFLGLTEVVFAVLIAWLLLGELPTVTQLFGGVLIVAGVALVRADELRLTTTRRQVAAGELMPAA